LATTLNLSEIQASTSAGITLKSNGGTSVALFGAGGGAGTTLYGGLIGTTATFKVSSNRNLAIKYDTNIALSAESDTGAPESLRMYADTFRIFTATTAVGLTERFTISNTGLVGIGTISPTAKLQISNTSAGAARVAAFLLNESLLENTEVRLAFAANTNNDIADGRYSYISALNTSGSNGQALSFATNETGTSATERMQIRAAGNVLISAGNATYPSSSGTSYGLQIFDKTSMAINVGGSLLFQGYKTSNTNVGNLASIVGKKENGTAGDESGFLGFLTSNSSGTFSEKFRITSAGNAGLGVTPTFQSGVTELAVGSSNTNPRISGIRDGASAFMIYSASASTEVFDRRFAELVLGTDNTKRFSISAAGYLNSTMTYGNTTATAANMVISTGGTFERSTSSIRYKTNIEDLTINTTNILSKMRPIWYRSLGQNDRKDWSWYGFIAEELAEIEPRLVQWGYDSTSYESIEIEDAEGNIKKETKLKDGEQLIPDGVQYERITVLLVAELQKMRKELDALKAK
jgi:hypothetical protein